MNNQLFNLNSYEKSKRNYFNKKENCNEKKKRFRVQTNPKFRLFDHMYYTAGDFDDFNKYGLLNFSYYFSLEHQNKNKVNNSSLMPLYRNINYDSVYHTFEYIFYKFKKGVFVMIQDSKLRCFLPMSNKYYENDFYRQTYLNDEEKQLLQSNQNYNSIKPILDRNLRDFMHHYRLKINLNRKKWIANNCWFRNQWPEYEGDLNYNVFKSFLKLLVKERKIEDCCFYINLRDFPILRKNLTHPFEHLYDDKEIKIANYKKMCPIFSQSITNKNADLLIPTNDDIIRVTQKYYTDKCDDQYSNEKDKLINRTWNKKIDKAVFRGGATGCGININTNPRLKVAKLGVEHPDVMNTGITDWNAKPKKHSGRPLEVIDIKMLNDMGIQLVDGIDNIEKSNYKYIINVDGSVSAFRLGYELSMNSVILKVNSDYKMWYSDLLEPMVHYIPIKKDCSDLVKKIEWCRKNDDKCKKIAQNAVKFYKKYLSEKGVLDYFQHMLKLVHHNMDTKNILSLPKLDKKIALISCYRDTGNGSREKQLKQYIKIAENYFNKIFDFDLYIVEQSEDGELFNIGKLKNIGFDLCEKSGIKYDLFIFTDIDMIPDHNLLSYYNFIPKTIMSLAYKGTRYDTDYKPFLGGLISVNAKTFKKINGYPNNYYGWGGEDDSLFIRMVSSKIHTIEVPKTGRVIDLEETLNVKQKLEKLKKNDAKENLKYDKLLLDTKYWKKNGLSSLNYDIINEDRISKNIKKITVDLKKKEDDKKLYPNGSEIKNFSKFKRETLDYLKTSFYDKINIKSV